MNVLASVIGWMAIGVLCFAIVRIMQRRQTWLTPARLAVPALAAVLHMCLATAIPGNDAVAGILAVSFAIGAADGAVLAAAMRLHATPLGLIAKMSIVPELVWVASALVAQGAAMLDSTSGLRLGNYALALAAGLLVGRGVVLAWRAARTPAVVALSWHCDDCGAAASRHATACSRCGNTMSPVA